MTTATNDAVDVVDVVDVLSQEELVAKLNATDESFVVVQHGQFLLTKTGVVVAGNAPAFNQWEAALKWAHSAEAAAGFWVGDLIAYGEHVYGEMYTQAMDATSVSYGSLANAVYVSRAVTADRRRPNLSFGVHQEVAPMSPSEQVKWLDRAEADGLSRTQLRTAIKIAKAQELGAAVDLWLLVKCATTEDQDSLAAKLRAEGRVVKSQVTKAHVPASEPAA